MSASKRSLSVLGPMVEGSDRVVTPAALAFIAYLVSTFEGQIQALLQAREGVQARLDAGERFDFLSETREVREADWMVAPLPDVLLDRRVEITGPADPKMIINALNSGANVFMADFEDSFAPTWENLIRGQAALQQAVRRTLRFEDSETGKQYALANKLALLMVRPRGLHLLEKHVTLGGKPIPASLFDFGLFFFHNAREQLARGAGPFFYLPKLESYLEARLWNDIFVFSEQAMGISPGTIKATVLLETLPAAFQMDEILYELREHSAGLNCGRWDYIFSYIKKLRDDASCVLPDRAQVGMDQHFLRSYTQLLIKTCHRRNVHAMGGMAAQIPIKNDAEQNRLALDKVTEDKTREVTEGHDGTWVAHPGLVPVARRIFDEFMPGPNQIHSKRDDVMVAPSDLLQVPTGTRTEAGLRHNIRVGVQYLAAWLSGQGCVPLYNLMEDAATAEISRTQIWQWIYHRVALDTDEPLTPDRFRVVLDEEMDLLRENQRAARWEGGHFQKARDLFEQLCTSYTCKEFLTPCAYEHLISIEKQNL